MIAPIAHAGHWAINLLYVAPLVIAVGVLTVQSMKDRRRKVRSGEPEGRQPPTELPPV